MAASEHTNSLVCFTIPIADQGYLPENRMSDLAERAGADMQEVGARHRSRQSNRLEIPACRPGLWRLLLSKGYPRADEDRVHNRTQAAIWAMSNGSFIPAETPPALEELPVEPFPNLDIAQALSAGHKNGSTSLLTLKLEGAGHVAMSGTLRLVRKNG